MQRILLGIITLLLIIFGLYGNREGLAIYLGASDEKTFYPFFVLVPFSEPEQFLQALFFTAAACLMVFHLSLVPKKLIRNAHPLPLPQLKWLCVIFFSGIFWSIASVFHPHWFARMTYEDGPIENLTFMCLLASTIMVICARFAHLRTRTRRDRLLDAGFFLLALGFFVFAMEEVSWMQRLWNIAPPEFFRENNTQKEINLHNLASKWTATFYLFISFVFLILIPFLHERTRLFEAYFKRFTPLIGRHGTVLAAAMLAAFSSAFASVMIQACFLLTFFILLLYLAERPGARLLAACIVAYALTQMIYIYSYYDFQKEARIGEFKELYIAIGYLAYALELWQRCRRKATGTD